MAIQGNGRKLDLDGLVFYVNGASEDSTPQPIPPETQRASRAGNFDGINQSLSSNSVDFNKGNESFSFGCWIKTTDIDGGIAGKWNPTPSFLINTLSGPGNYRILMNNGATQTILDTGVPVSGNWQFIVFTYDTVNIRFSVDGGAFLSQAHTGGGNPAANSDPFVIGAYAGIKPLDGQIDNAFFYNKALSLAEIQALHDGAGTALGTSYQDLTDAQKTDLVSWWGMNETTGERLDIHGGNNLTEVNGPISNVDGKVLEYYVNDFIGGVQGTPAPSIVLENGAYEFDGIDEEIVFNNPFDFSGTDYSVDMWFNSAVDPVNPTESDLCYKLNQYFLRTNQGNGTITYVLYGTVNTSFATPSGQFTVGDWANVTTTFNFTTKEAKIYVNGVEKATFTYTGIHNPSSGTFQIGRGVLTTDRTYSGKISQTKVYYKALTAQEIQANYNLFKSKFGH